MSFILEIFGIIFIFLVLTEIVNSYRDIKTAQVDDLTAKLTKLVHVVNIEQHHDTQYWFDKQSDEFLGQGQTQEEIIEVIKNRFPKHIFVFDNTSPPKALHGPNWQFTDLSKIKTSELDIL